MLSEKIKLKLSEDLDIISLEIIDESYKHANHAQSNGGHFKVKIVSDDFKDKSLIERHRMVYGILDEMIKKEIHALSIEARTSQE
jgi:BolA protein